MKLAIDKNGYVCTCINVKLVYMYFCINESVVYAGMYVCILFVVKILIEYIFLSINN